MYTALAGPVGQPDPVMAKFRHFLSNFPRSYGHDTSSLEFQKRFSIFQENLLRLKATQAEREGWEASVEDSPFGDLTEMEIQLQALMPKRPPVQPWAESFEGRPVNAPAAFDWRGKGAVTPVKDQGSLGTCWAFSAIQNLEGQLFLTRGTLLPLSVEQLVECDNSDDPTKQRADCAVFGGWPYLAFDFLKRAGGVWLDSEWPYCAGFTNKSQCFPCMPAGYSKADCGDHSDMYCNGTASHGQGPEKRCQATTGQHAQVSGWQAYPEDENVLIGQLATVGPLSVALNAGGLSFYRKGIYSPRICNPKDLDHAVLIVGYGEEGGKGYWTVKNSWGPKWGEEGYFRIERGTGKCGINTQVASAFLAN